MSAHEQDLLRTRSPTGTSSRAATLAILAVVLCASIAHAGINIWTSNGPAGGPVPALAIDPHTPSTLYAGTGACVSDPYGAPSCTGNLFKSTDGGTTWTVSATGLPSLPVVSVLAIDPRTPTTLYAGTECPGGLFKSPDGGTGWSPTGFYTPIALAIAPDASSTLYAGVAGAGVLKSTDGGSTWEDINPSPAGDYTVVVALAIDPSTPTTLYAESVYGRSGALKSTDGGGSWSEINTGLTEAIGAFAIDPVMPSTLYVGKFKSTDGGGSWSALDVAGGVLAIDPLNPSTLYAAGNGVFRSTDGGTHWQAFNSGLTTGDVRVLAVAATMPPTLYAGTGNGVFAIQPTTFTVNSAADAPDAMPGDGVCATADGVCTLRAAVEEANAFPGADSIAVPGGTYFLTAGTLAISDDLTIVGAGAGTTIIDGNGPYPGFAVVSIGARVTIAAATVQNGHGLRGGGIVNGGDLTLTNVTVSGNTSESGDSASSYGGGILNDGTLVLTDVTISGNAVGPGIGPPAYGGGIYNSGSATLINVTVSGNTAHTKEGSPTWGGGIYNSGTLTATNCTISGNTAAEDNRTNGRGGGIYNDGSATLRSVTISGNSANAADDAGGGIFDGGPTSAVTLKNAIVADSPAGGDCSRPPISRGYNLDSDGTCGLSGPGDLSNVDPKLGLLQDNGGPTFTQALLPGSPAIDAGSFDCPPPATDQRGVARTSPCDIGAYESAPVSGAPSPTVTSVPTTTGSATGTVTAPASPTPSSTATRTSSATSSRCVGDCHEHGRVTIDGLLTMVNIALGNAPVSACEAGDRNADLHITIDEILAAVHNALNGCPAS